MSKCLYWFCPTFWLLNYMNSTSNLASEAEPLQNQKGKGQRRVLFWRNSIHIFEEAFLCSTKKTLRKKSATHNRHFFLVPSCVFHAVHCFQLFPWAQQVTVLFKEKKIFFLPFYLCFLAPRIERFIFLLLLTNQEFNNPILYISMWISAYKLCILIENL